MAKTNKTEEPWLMACALLGLSQLEKLMVRHNLTLREAESQLRGLTEDYLVILSSRFRRDLPSKIEWARVDLPARCALTSWLIESADEQKMMKRSPRMEPFELTDLKGHFLSTPKLTKEGSFECDKKEIPARSLRIQVPKGGSVADYRPLMSWLLDEKGGKHGEKILIAAAFDRSTSEDRWRRIKQLRADSRTVLDALRLNPHRVRRRTVGGEALRLAKLSLAHQDRGDEERVLKEMALRQKLEDAKGKVKKIREELKAFLRWSRKTGR